MKLFNAIKLLFAMLLLAAMGSNAAVESLAIEKAGFIGEYYQAASSTLANQPVLVLGGSEGGIPKRLAKGVAELGYPTLAVAFFGEGNLPAELEKIPLSYFDNAKAWLLERHFGKGSKITVVGWSKGAELALLLASKDASIGRVVAIAPSSVAWAGILKDWQKVPGSSWMENGKELPYIAFNPTGPVTGLLDLYSQSLENRKDNGNATIPVENINGEVILFSGGKDEIWPSSVMAQTICGRMKKLSKSNCKHFEYPELDHLLEYRFLDNSDPIHQIFAKSLTGG